MTRACSTDSGNCKDSDIIYGVIDHHAQKLHRLTFSHSLAQLIADSTGLQVAPFTFELGHPLEPGEKSFNGLYALMDTRKGMCLRISLDPRIASIHCDDKYRHLRNVYLSRN